MPCWTVAAMFALGLGLAAGVGDRHQRHVGEGVVQLFHVVQVLSSVQGGDRAVGDGPKHREVKLVDVEMEDIEFVAPSRARGRA